MGMNYYWNYNICDKCGRAEETLHIGKSSYGWCFSLHIYPERGINTLADWEEKFKVVNSNIIDEEDRVISVPEMLSIIKDRRGNINLEEKPFLSFHYKSFEDFLYKNSAERGHCNLLRHRIGNFCVKHGEGTYDYIIGDFC